MLTRALTLITLAFVFLLSAGCDNEATRRAQQQAHEERMAKIQAEVEKEKARLQKKLESEQDWNTKKKKIGEAFAGLLAAAAFFGSIALAVVGLRKLGGEYLQKRRALEARRDIILKAIDAACEIARSMPPEERQKLSSRITAAANNPHVLDVEFKLLT